MPPRETASDRLDRRRARHVPTTPMQALMETAPGENVAATSMHEHEMGEVLDSLLSEMSERDRAIVTMHAAGISVREIAEIIGTSKTTVHRILPDLLAEVARLFNNSPEVQEYIYGPDTADIDEAE